MTRDELAVAAHLVMAALREADEREEPGSILDATHDAEKRKQLHGAIVDLCLATLNPNPPSMHVGKSDKGLRIVGPVVGLWDHVGGDDFKLVGFTFSPTLAGRYASGDDSVWETGEFELLRILMEKKVEENKVNG